MILLSHTITKGQVACWLVDATLGHTVYSLGLGLLFGDLFGVGPSTGTPLAKYLKRKKPTERRAALRTLPICRESRAGCGLASPDRGGISQEGNGKQPVCDRGPLPFFTHGLPPLNKQNSNEKKIPKKHRVHFNKI